MNVPNKITMCRIIMSVFLMVLLIFPIEKVGLVFPSFEIVASKGTIILDTKYIVCGIIFLVAALTDFLDGFLARKYNIVTDFGKVLDAIADKFLVSSVLIILSSQGIIHPIITIVIITRDIIIDVIKMMINSKRRAVAEIKSDKVKTIFLMIGMSLTLFGNLPFELMNIQISDVLLIIAATLSVYSVIQWYQINKETIKE